ncbi:MAG: endonuclease/exonuclease/phosphatase family protein [Bacteroidota bacterium]
MKLIYTLLLLIIAGKSTCQSNFRIVFYNVENLFDTYDNPKTNDGEFTATGSRHWTNYRYWQKIKKTSKTLKIIGEWEAPAIIGLAEIENDTVLKNLIYSDALRKYNYKYIHRDSPDHRGIDVAFLYRKDKFFPISYKFYPLIDENGEKINSREILFAKGIVKGGDTLNFFILHFPSRYGGYKKSEPKRINAVKQLISIIDSINNTRINPKIIVMGDFNDTPLNSSIKMLDRYRFINLLNADHGTHKHQGKWTRLDHFFVSNSLLDKSNKVYLKYSTRVFMAKFLQKKDNKYTGFKPHRTYTGYKYNNGFSDHLPIFTDLVFIK